MKNILLLLFLPLALAAQNTIGGEAKIVPEAEVNRQSDFVDAERERLLAHNDEAVDLYKKFLYENPSNDAAWYGLARSYQAAGKMAEALEAASKAVNADPTNQWYRILQADMLEQNGQAKEAARIYEDLTKRFPQTPEFWQHYAYLSVLAGDPQGGLKALDRLEKLTGVTEESADEKHLIYIGLGDNKKAAAELLKLADAYPEKTEYRRRLADFYERIGDNASARRAYEEVLRHNPDDPVAKLAVLEKDKGSSDVVYLQSLQPLFRDPNISIDAKVKEILPYFSKLDQGNDPALTQTLLDLGGLLEKAHADDPKAWSLSGDLLYHANRPSEALTRYRKCIQLNPTVFAVWDNALTIMRDQKNYDELLHTAEQAMDAFPNQAKAYYYYGVAATEKGRPDDALPQLEQAALMSGSNRALWLDITDQIGQALLRKKDAVAAINRLEAALSKGGDQHPGLLEHYGDALFTNGDKNKAIEYWQKANTIAPTPGLQQKINTGKL